LFRVLCVIFGDGERLAPGDLPSEKQIYYCVYKWFTETCQEPDDLIVDKGKAIQFYIDVQISEDKTRCGMKFVKPRLRNFFTRVRLIQRAFSKDTDMKT
jgi:hypothetical protein